MTMAGVTGGGRVGERGSDDREFEGPGIVESLWRYRGVVIAATVLGLVLGFGVSQFVPERYQAESQLTLRDPANRGVLGGTSRAGDLEPYLARQTDLVTSPAVLEMAAQQLANGQSVAGLREALSVGPSADLAAVVIRAEGPDPASAAAMANAVGDAYQQVGAQRVADEAGRALASLEGMRGALQAELDANVAAAGTLAGDPLTPQQSALVGQLSALRERAQDISTEAAVYGSGVELFIRAEEPVSPAQPKPARNAAVGGLLGLLAAGAWAWRVSGRDLRVDRRYDPGAVLGAPLLGEVPEFRAPSMVAGKPVPPLAHSGPVINEAYHYAVTSLSHALASVGGTSVVVTSATPGDGKTLTLLSMAMAAQEQQRRVVLVDADERMRRLSELCGQREGLGLCHLGEDAAGVDNHLHSLQVTGGDIVPVLPSGVTSDHPVGVFRTVAFRKALLHLHEQADLVLIDAPALLGVSDTIAVAAQADGVVLVIERGTLVSDLRAVHERLALVGTPLLGYIFNRSAESLDPYARSYSRTVTRAARNRNNQSPSRLTAVSTRVEPTSRAASRDKGETSGADADA